MENSFSICVLCTKERLAQKLKGICESLGFEFSHYMSSQKLLNYWANDRYHCALVLICDWNNEEEVQLLHQHELVQTKDIPILLLNHNLLTLLNSEDKNWDIDALPQVIPKYSIKEDLIIDQEIREAFLEEANQLLQEAEQLLLDLEHGEAEQSVLGAIFQIVHTMKGSSSAMEWAGFSHYFHSYEEILCDLRDGKMSLTAMIIDMLIKGFDRFNYVISQLVKDHNWRCDLEPWLEELRNAISKKSSSAQAKSVQVETDQQSWQGERTVKVPIDSLSDLSYQVACMLDEQKKLMKVVDESFRETTNVGQLNLVHKLIQDLQNHEKKVIETLEEVRCVPMGTILKPLRRLVRDVSRSLGKQVKLKCSGEDLRVDASIASVLNHALIHLLRNSIDHGIEALDVRKLSNKDSHGLIQIDIAKNDLKGEVVVILSDDGKGIDLKMLERKAVEKNLYTPNKLEQMSESEKLNIIFMPGFSTAEAVTNVSGVELVWRLFRKVSKLLAVIFV